MDETGVPLDPKPLKSIQVKGEKNPSAFSSGSKKQITVVGCVSASGQCLPSMVIFDRKTLNPELAEGEVPGTDCPQRVGWTSSSFVYGFHVTSSGMCRQHVHCSF